MVTVGSAARAKSLAVGLAQRPDRQGQKHLLPQHIFKQQTVFLIIPDFGLVRCNRPLRAVGVDANGAENEVEIRSERNLDWLDTARARCLKPARKLTPEPDTRDIFLRAAVLVNHLCAARCGKIANLLRLAAKIHRARSQLKVKLD